MGLRESLLLVALLGCGRIGFDTGGDGPQRVSGLYNAATCLHRIIPQVSGVGFLVVWLEVDNATSAFALRAALVGGNGIPGPAQTIEVIDPTRVLPIDPSQTSLTATALPSGYRIHFFARELDVFDLDPSGQRIGRVDGTSGPFRYLTIVDAGTSQVAVYEAGSVIWASVLGADGLPTTPIRVDPDIAGKAYPSATWVGDAILAVYQDARGGGAQLRATRVDAAGAPMGASVQVHAQVDYQYLPKVTGTGPVLI